MTTPASCNSDWQSDSQENDLEFARHLLIQRITQMLGRAIDMGRDVRAPGAHARNAHADMLRTVLPQASRGR
jgi:hypothetical protein